MGVFFTIYNERWQSPSVHTLIMLILQRTLSVGDIGTVRLPKPDRKKGALVNVPCKVVDILGNRLKLQFLDPHFEEMAEEVNRLIPVVKFRPRKQSPIFPVLEVSHMPCILQMHVKFEMHDSVYMGSLSTHSKSK